MAGYFIANYDITDKEKYKSYVEKAGALTVKHGGRPVVLTSRFERVEGEAKKQMVVVKFPSLEAANAWYNDPEYQAIIHLRHESTSNAWAIISPEFELK